MNDIEFLYGELINLEVCEGEEYDEAYKKLCDLDYEIDSTKDDTELRRLRIKREITRNKVSRILGGLEMVNNILNTIAMYNDDLYDKRIRSPFIESEIGMNWIREI